MTRTDALDHLVASITMSATQLPQLACYGLGSTEIERDIRIAAEVLDDLITRLGVARHSQNLGLFHDYDDTGHGRER